MTIQGIISLLISSFAAAFIFFMLVIKTRQRDRNNSEISASDLIFGSIVSILIFFLSIAVSFVFIVCSSKSYTHYHTIYSNQLNADVKFVDSDSVEFIGGQPIKSTSEETTGTLTLSKNDTTVNREDDVEVDVDFRYSVDYTLDQDRLRKRSRDLNRALNDALDQEAYMFEILVPFTASGAYDIDVDCIDIYDDRAEEGEVYAVVSDEIESRLTDSSSRRRMKGSIKPPSDKDIRFICKIPDEE